MKNGIPARLVVGAFAVLNNIWFWDLGILFHDVI